MAFKTIDPRVAFAQQQERSRARQRIIEQGLAAKRANILQRAQWDLEETHRQERERQLGLQERQMQLQEQEAKRRQAEQDLVRRDLEKQIHAPKGAMEKPAAPPPPPPVAPAGPGVDAAVGAGAGVGAWGPAAQPPPAPQLGGQPAARQPVGQPQAPQAPQTPERAAATAQQQSLEQLKGQLAELQGQKPESLAGMKALRRKQEALKIDITNQQARVGVAAARADVADQQYAQRQQQAQMIQSAQSAYAGAQTEEDLHAIQRDVLRMGADVVKAAHPQFEDAVQRLQRTAEVRKATKEANDERDVADTRVKFNRSMGLLVAKQRTEIQRRIDNRNWTGAAEKRFDAENLIMAEVRSLMAEAALNPVVSNALHSEFAAGRATALAALPNVKPPDGIRMSPQGWAMTRQLIGGLDQDVELDRHERNKIILKYRIWAVEAQKNGMQGAGADFIAFRAFMQPRPAATPAQKYDWD